MGLGPGAGGPWRAPVLGRGSSCGPGKGPEKAFQAPRLSEPPCNTDSSLKSSFFN